MSDGRFVVSGVVGGGTVYIYSATGRLEDSLGREGAGPGEFGRTVRVAVGVGDTIYAVDDSQRRAQVFSSSGNLVRGFAVPAANRSFALLSNGSLLMTRTPTGPTDSLFHLLSSLGEEIAQFGTPTMQEYDLETWVVSARPGGGYWTGSIWRYEAIRSGGLGANNRTVFVRQVDWFPPDPPFPENIYTTSPPPAFLDHVEEDAEGRLWTYSLVPDNDWTPSDDPPRPSPEWYRRTFDTIVEVIDTGRAQVISRGRYDGRLGAMCGSVLKYTVIETPAGDTRIEIIRPTIQGSDR